MERASGPFLDAVRGRHSAEGGLGPGFPAARPGTRRRGPAGENAVATSKPSERRRAPRLRVGGRMGAQARAWLDVRLMDLSLTGARIEHRDVLQPGSTCTFEFPPALGGLLVAVRVVHSTIVGGVPGPGEQPHARYQSGLEFVGLKADQRARLAGIVERLGERPAAGEGRVRL
jgi:hypothetical protein